MATFTLKRGTLIADNDKVFGDDIKFFAKHRDVFETDEDGNQTSTVERRVYNLKCRKLGRAFTVSVPGDIPDKDFAVDTPVKLINPTFNCIASYGTDRSISCDYFVSVDDLIMAGTPKQDNQSKPQQQSNSNNRQNQAASK